MFKKYVVFCMILALASVSIFADYDQEDILEVGESPFERVQNNGLHDLPHEDDQLEEVGEDKENDSPFEVIQKYGLKPARPADGLKMQKPNNRGLLQQVRGN